MNGLIGENGIDEAVTYQKGPLQIRVRKTADVAAVALLKQTIYGTNGIQYQHIGQEQKIRQLSNPFFFHLFFADELIGMYCLDERTVSIQAGEFIQAYYGRYLAIARAHQGKGYGRLIKEQAIRYVEVNCQEPLIFYSFIEEKNSRSLRISQSEGFKSVATLKTFVFRRYAPKIAPQFSRISIQDNGSLKSILSQSYKKHSLTTLAKIGHEGNYFTLLEKDDVIAGVQANPVCWNFLAMPGRIGWIMMNILPRFSATRRFFNPSQYQFVALEGIYVKEGREAELPVLLESVLAYFGYHSALLQVDITDPLNRSLSDTKKMGRLSGYQKNILTHVMVKAEDKSIVAKLSEKPVYVSSFDFT
ncbi:GNAT family N-acetyltransferase [Spirosoma sp. KNUC1025]|uniref:GNAT family N-acetyltransferase n=1 Tax=Spirosoma sp. KNUC1025 TaxID=2894082 RepID=UPI003869817B|nr:GNAT family N-acetyltransferase [Spirosoma sp. KNUC1025]